MQTQQRHFNQNPCNKFSIAGKTLWRFAAKKMKKSEKKTMRWNRGKCN